MLYSSVVLLTCAAVAHAANKLEMQMYQVGTGTINLGGASTTSSFGVKYRIDDGDWKTASPTSDHSPCQKDCDDGDKLTYDLDELATNVDVCQFDRDSICVPGTSFSCKFMYGDKTLTFDSEKKSDFIGIAQSTGTFCGGIIFDD